MAAAFDPESRQTTPGGPRLDLVSFALGVLAASLAFAAAWSLRGA
jgi:hypothetical protein